MQAPSLPKELVEEILSLEAPFDTEEDKETCSVSAQRTLSMTNTTNTDAHMYTLSCTRMIPTETVE